MADILGRVKALWACPLCGKLTEVTKSNHVICWDCGEFLYDVNDGVWRIRKFCNDYNEEEKASNKKQEGNQNE